MSTILDPIDHPHQWYGGRTYAQHGDDLALLNIFGRLRISQPSYLDIGAHHPVELSNTALFYQRGSRGINVEANPDLMESFLRMRPEDKNVQCAVVPKPTSTVILHRVSRFSGINSVLPIGHATDPVEVPALTINQIIEEVAGNEWPDLLSIDVEGLDVDVLRSIDYAHGYPKVICAEAVSQYGDVSAELRATLLDNDYAVHSWAGGNMLFVRASLIGMCR